VRLESAATANFIVHASWAASRCADACVETGPELTVVDSGLGVDTFNIVCGARLTPEDVSERARRVREYFASVARPFSWWVAPGDEPSDLGARLAHEGLSRVESEVAMAATLAPGFGGEVEVPAVSRSCGPKLRRSSPNLRASTPRTGARPTR
jgi:hypothetical protein